MTPPEARRELSLQEQQLAKKCEEVSRLKADEAQLLGADRHGYSQADLLEVRARIERVTLVTQAIEARITTLRLLLPTAEEMAAAQARASQLRDGIIKADGALARLWASFTEQLTALAACAEGVMKLRHEALRGRELLGDLAREYDIRAEAPPEVTCDERRPLLELRIVSDTLRGAREVDPIVRRDLAAVRDEQVA
jgi:hypothetical protein